MIAFKKRETVNSIYKKRREEKKDRKRKTEDNFISCVKSNLLHPQRIVGNY